MKFHAIHYRCLISGSWDKALIIGFAGGRVRYRVGYQPKDQWLYSFRVFLLIFKVEVLWRTGRSAP